MQDAQENRAKEILAIPFKLHHHTIVRVLEMPKPTQGQVIKVQQDTQDRWSGWFRFTARFRYPHISPLRKIVSTLTEFHISRRSDWRVLEFGFGHGHLLFWFRPPTRIFEIELSEQTISAAITRATKMGYPEYEFKKPDFENSARCDFPRGFFNLVVCSHTLEHMWDDEALIHEFHRVLKPDGVLLIVVPHDLQHSDVLAERDARINPRFPESSYHVSNYNLETLEYLAKLSGFELKKAERFDAVMSWRDRWPRSVAQLFSIALSVLPYSLFKVLDAKAVRAGYSGRQALIFCGKKELIHDRRYATREKRK